MIRHAIFTALIVLFAYSLGAAEVVTVTYTEPDESEATGTGAQNLSYCTIYSCTGALCTNWRPMARVAASSADGGQERTPAVVLSLQEDQLPRTVRFAVSCTDLNGNESSILATTGGGTGNPITFTAP